MFFIFFQSILLIFLRERTNQVQVQMPILIGLCMIVTMAMDRTSIYVMEIDTCHNYTVLMLCYHSKITFGLNHLFNILCPGTKYYTPFLFRCSIVSHIISAVKKKPYMYIFIPFSYVLYECLWSLVCVPLFSSNSQNPSYNASKRGKS